MGLDDSNFGLDNLVSNGKRDIFDAEKEKRQWSISRILTRRDNRQWYNEGSSTLNWIYAMENSEQRRNREFFEWKTKEEIILILKDLLDEKWINELDFLIIKNSNFFNFDLINWITLNAFVYRIFWERYINSVNFLKLKELSRAIWIKSSNLVLSEIMTKDRLSKISTIEDFKGEVFYTKSLDWWLEYSLTWLEILQYYEDQWWRILIDIKVLLKFFETIDKQDLIYNFVDEDWKKEIEKQIYIDSLSPEEKKQKALEALAERWYTSSLDIISWIRKWNLLEEKELGIFNDFFHIYNSVMDRVVTTYVHIWIKKLDTFIKELGFWGLLEAIKEQLEKKEKSISIMYVNKEIEEIRDIVFFKQKWWDKIELTWNDIVKTYILFNSEQVVDRITRNSLSTFMIDFKFKDKLLLKAKEILNNNWFVDIKDLLSARNNEDYSWDYGIFKTFLGLINFVLNMDIQKESKVDQTLLLKLTKAVWLEINNKF